MSIGDVCTMRAFARNASSRDELKDEEDPASPPTPLDYSGTTPGSNLKGRPTARFSSIELIQRDFDKVPRDEGKRHGSDAGLPLRVPQKDSRGV